MNQEYEIRVTRLLVNRIGEPIFAPCATTVEIDDQAAGEYLVIRQDHDQAKNGEIYIEAEQWPKIKEAIETLLPTLDDRETESEEGA